MENETGQRIASPSLSLEGQNEKKKSLKRTKMFGWLGIGLCGLACALPFIGVIAGISFFTAIAVYLERFAILALGFAAVFFAYAHYQKKKKDSGQSSGASCAVDGSCGCSTASGSREETGTESL